MTSVVKTIDRSTARMSRLQLECTPTHNGHRVMSTPLLTMDTKLCLHPYTQWTHSDRIRLQQHTDKINDGPRKIPAYIVGYITTQVYSV